MSEKVLSKATAEDLPATIKIRLSDMDESYMFVSIFGWIIISAGLGIYFFGPDEITYNVFRGPTIGQILLASGLYIASLGVAVCALASKLKKKCVENHLAAKEALVNEALNFDDKDIPAGYETSITWLDGRTFRVEFAKKEQVGDTMHEATS